MGSAAVEPGGKDRDDLQDVFGKIFFKRAFLPLVEDDDFNIFCFADGEYELSTESEQPVFMGYDQPSDIPGKDGIQ